MFELTENYKYYNLRKAHHGFPNINRIQVFSLSGALIQEYRPGNLQQQITIENPGTYLVKTYLAGGKVNVNKIVKL